MPENADVKREHCPKCNRVTHYEYFDDDHDVPPLDPRKPFWLCVECGYIPMETLRGHDIIKIDGEFFYCDDMTAVTTRRDCGFCGKADTPEGHDGCLGTLKGDVMNACCGHGDDRCAYVQFWHKDADGERARISGKGAMEYIAHNRQT